MDELSSEELNSLNKRDSMIDWGFHEGFGEFYKKIKVVRDSILRTNTEKSKYNDITYEDYFSLIEFYSDTFYWGNVNEGVDERWERKYGIIDKEIDSVIDYYNKRYEENKFEELLRIELVDVNTKYYSYSSGIREVYFGFRLKPLKGTIQQVIFYYTLTPKIEVDEKDEDVEDDFVSSLLNTSDLFTDILNRNGCESVTPFSKPVTRYWEVDYKLRKQIGGRTVGDILRDYEVKIEIDRIRMNNKNLTTEDFEIPLEIERYNKWGDGILLKSKKNIGERFLNKEYESSYMLRLKVHDSIVDANEKFRRIRELEDRYIDFKYSSE